MSARNQELTAAKADLLSAAKLACDAMLGDGVTLRQVVLVVRLGDGTVTQAVVDPARLCFDLLEARRIAG